MKIRDDCTLEELFEIANQYSIGSRELSVREYNKLIRLFTVYGEDVLNCGQVVQVESVSLSKSISGDVSIYIPDQGTSRSSLP